MAVSVHDDVGSLLVIFLLTETGSAPISPSRPSRHHGVLSRILSDTTLQRHCQHLQHHSLQWRRWDWHCWSSRDFAGLSARWSLMRLAARSAALSRVRRSASSRCWPFAVPCSSSSIRARRSYAFSHCMHASSLQLTLQHGAQTTNVHKLPFHHHTHSFPNRIA